MAPAPPEGCGGKGGQKSVNFALSASACYKNAGENLEPTSNRVELDDLTPTLTRTDQQCPSYDRRPS